MSISFLRRFYMAVLAFLVAGYTGLFFWVHQGMAAVPELNPISDPETLNPVEPVLFTDANPWARPGMEKMASQVENYRLSGTYQTFSEETPGSGVREKSSIALVDDLKSGKQHMVHVGDTLGPFEIKEISSTSIRLSHDNQQFTLALSGQIALGGSRGGSGEKSLTREERFDQLPTLEITPYGKRIADNQWVER